MPRNSESLPPVRKTDSACEMCYPMYVIPASEFLKLPRLLPHDVLLRRGVLKEWTPASKGKVILASHQWLKYTEPDPNNEHFLTLQRLLQRLMARQFKAVDDFWLHKALFRTRATRLGSKEWESVHVWIDYSCMPQIGPDSDRRAIRHAAAAVKSIPAYVEQCHLLLVVAPVCRHQDSGELCSYASWRTRGWCLMELKCSILARRLIRTMVCVGEGAKPWMVHPFEGCRLSIEGGQFSCCTLGHKINGVEIECDKVKVRGVLQQMLSKKIEHYRLLGANDDCHFLTSIHHAFMKGLPAPPRTAMEQAQLSLERMCGPVDLLRSKLRWEEADERRSRSTGFTLLLCGALMDDLAAVQQLLQPREGRGEEVNMGLKRNLFHLAYMMRGATPLIAAMTYGTWPTVQTLLDAGAEPRKTLANGMDALFTACCKGNLPNIQAWLRHFPNWQINRTDPMMGFHVTCLTAMAASAHVLPVLKCLVEAKGAVDLPECWGGENSMLCLLSSNEHVSEDAVKFLLRQGCDVNGRFCAQKFILRRGLQAARMAQGLPHGCQTAVDEVAMLEGSVPLHFAAKRGDVKLITCLLQNRADPSLTNAQGRTPLEVARAFFGTVPEVVVAVLEGWGKPEDYQQPRASLGDKHSACPAGTAGPAPHRTHSSTGNQLAQEVEGQQQEADEEEDDELFEI